MSEQDEKEPVQVSTSVVTGDQGLSQAEATAWVDRTVETLSISIEPHEGVSVALSEEDVSGIDVNKLSTIGDRTFYDGVEITNPKYFSARPMYPQFAPHPHSLEGRMARMEDTLSKLLALMVEGEQAQETASCVVPMLAGLGKGDFIKELKALCGECQKFSAELQDSPTYHALLAGLQARSSS